MPDTRYIDARLRRAKRIDAPDSGFLADIAAEEIAARIGAVNRDFRSILDFASVGNRAAERLAELLPDARIDRKTLREVLESGGTDGCGESEEPYDLVVSLFGLHWHDDPRSVLRAIHERLRPDGLFVAALPGRGTLEELRSSMLKAEAILSDGAADRVDRFPDLSQAGAMLQAAGFALPVADMDRHVLRYRDTRRLLGDLRAIGTAPRKAPAIGLPRGILGALEEAYRRDFGEHDGRIAASVNLIYLTGWTPHESQQQPMRPGSAEVSLASVLKKR